MRQRENIKSCGRYCREDELKDHLVNLSREAEEVWGYLDHFLPRLVAMEVKVGDQGSDLLLLAT